MKSDKIFAATIPWFEPYTFGLLRGSEDPHEAKAVFMSHSPDDEDMHSEAAFVHHVLGMQEKIKELEQRLAVVMKELEVNLKKYHDCEQDLGERLADTEKKLSEYIKECVEANQRLAESEKRLVSFTEHHEKMCFDYTDRINAQAERLAEAEDVIEFYAEMKHAYDGKLSHADCDPWQFDGEGGTKMMFGKRAREYQAKFINVGSAR